MKAKPTSPDAAITVANTQRRLRVPVRRVRELVSFVADAEGRSIGEVEIAVVGRQRMATLNEAHLGHAGPTDVLSFDLTGDRGDGVSAVIVVCADVAVRQGRRRGHAAWRELLLYITHGLLHVMGYDDATAGQAERMHAREDELLDTFGVGRVYGRP